MEGNYIECECHSPEHTLRYSLDHEDQVIYVSVYLDQYHPWYERAWIAVKYLFGYKCRYGHFDCVLMGPEQVEQLKKVLQEFENVPKDPWYQQIPPNLGI